MRYLNCFLGGILAAAMYFHFDESERLRDSWENLDQRVVSRYDYELFVKEVQKKLHDHERAINDMIPEKKCE